MADSGVRASVSPEATGGAGTVEEYRFAAVVLVKLLRGDYAPGLQVPLLAVGLQRREAGNILDDVVLQASLDSDGLRTEYQVKRSMSPTVGDKQFLDALDQCLESLDVRAGEIAAGRLALGLAAERLAGPLQQLHKLTTFARAHATVMSFRSVVLKSGAVDADVRSRYDSVAAAVVASQKRRGKLLETLDFHDLTFRLLRAVHVWQFSIGPDGRDTVDALNRLADVLPANSSSAGDVFVHLVDAAETWGPKAGLITAGMVRAELERRGVALSAEPKQRDALAKLRAVTDRQLSETPWSIGGQLELPRTATSNQIVDALTKNRFVLVSGAPGAGKSVLARRVVRDLPATSTAVIIDLAGRGRGSLAELQAELGVELAVVLASAPTTGQRVLLIDGAEHALLDGARLLRAVLGVIPLDTTSAPPWTVMVTSRTEATDVVRRCLPEAPAEIIVSEGDDEELAEIVGAYPRLVPLTRHPRSQRLLRRPYLVDVLIRTRVDLTGRVLGEEDVMELVWNELIRRGEGARPGQGSPHDRNRVCRALAEDVLRAATGTPLDSAPGEAVDGLLRDEVLVRQRTRHRFAHDILLDYALAMRLLEDDRHALLVEAPEKRPLLRAVRLALQRLLTDAVAMSPVDVVTEWSVAVRLSATLAELDGPRWKDVPFEALLAMSDPGPALVALRALLLQQDGRQLHRLVEVTRRLATLSEREPDGEGLKIDALLAAPVVDALASMGDGLPFVTTVVAADLVRRWLLAITRNNARLTDYLTDPRQLCRTVALWAEGDEYGDRLEIILAAIGLLAGYHTAEASTVFERVRRRNHQLSVIVEEAEVARAAARDPDLLLSLAGRYYLDQALTLDPTSTPARDESRVRRTRRRPHTLDTDDGVRDHTPRFRKVNNVGFAAPHYGPFTALLHSSPTHGLRLIGAVLDAASAARIAIETSPGNNPVEALIIRRSSWAEAITYRDTPTAWCWFQRSGMAAYPAMSAAMALAEWAIEQLDHRSLDDVLDQVLAVSRTFTAPAIGFALCVARLDLVADQLDAFLEHPLVWDVEQARLAYAQSNFGYAIKGHGRLTWSIDQVVMNLVLRGDSERRRALGQIGDRLVENSRTRMSVVPHDPTDESMLVARRRALCFDIQSYRTSTVDVPEGMTAIEINYPRELLEGLDRSRGAHASLNLQLASITTKAVRIRDRELREDPTPLWAQLFETIARLDEFDEDRNPIYSRQDAMAAVAAAIITAAAHYEISTTDQLLNDSITVLAEVMAGEDTERRFAHLTSRETNWAMGATRSAATALPLVLSVLDIATRCGPLHARVEAAIAALARYPSSEVRQRLAGAMYDDLMRPCEQDPHRQHAHTRVLTTLRTLVVTSGFASRTDGHRQRVELTEPLRDALGPGDDVLHISNAAAALSGLTRAAQLACPHGTEATDLLGTLIDHDVCAWPQYFARHHYEGIEEWRDQLDMYVAKLILDGDTVVLDRYLDGFAGIAEDLRGLLEQLAAQATTAERGERLLRTCWPTIFGNLLPSNRNLDDDHSHLRPYHQDVDHLDRTLLPMPPAGARWPRDALMAIMTRWVEAFTATPHVADRAILCLAHYGVLSTPLGTALILRVLGSNTEVIRQRSQTVTAWLHLALIDDKMINQPYRKVLLTLLDHLAEAGDTNAAELQRELELQ